MTDERHARYTELLPSHVLGALEGEEREELERHLETGCPRCEGELAAWTATLEALAEQVPPVEPPAALRARIRRLGRRAAPSWGRRGWAAGLAAVLASLLLWGGWLHLGLRRQVGRLAEERAALSARLQQVELRLGEARAELAEMRRAIGIAASSGVRSAVLAGLEAAPGAAGRALVDPETGRGVFHAHGLPAPPPGRTYQLWFIAAAGPVSAGVFDVGPRGEAALLLEGVAPPGEIQAWAVTVEPQGGVPQPTGEVVLKGAQL